jgi:putative membrane protein
MSRVMPITSALVAAMLAAAPGALAQDTAGSPWPTVRRQPTVFDTGTTAALADTSYIRQAIRGNLTEVALGRLAESRASDSAVKEFGERMISEHNSMNEQWGKLAQNNSMRVDVDFGPAGKQSIERLKDLDGTGFDQAYMAEMIRQHEQDLAAFQGMRVSARSPEVRQLATSGVSTIDAHLALARQVGSRVGISTTAGRAGGVTNPAPAPSDEDRARRAADRNDRTALRTEDREFVETVLGAHLLEIRLAEQARREARSGEIRRFAEWMEDDSKEWQERWVEVAGRYDVNVPSHLGTLRSQKVEKLERASKRNFDRTYAALVVEHLEAVLPYYEKEGQAVRPAAVRRLVNDELPAIRENLARARRLEKQ